MVLDRDEYIGRRDQYLPKTYGGIFGPVLDRRFGEPPDDGWRPPGQTQPTAPGQYAPYDYNPQSHAQTINYRHGEDAADINARLIRAEYEDYRSRFLPLERELMRLALDPAERQKAIDRAGEEVESSFKQAEQQSTMQAQRYGIKDPSRQTGVKRGRDLARSAAIANAKNKTRVAQDDLMMQIMTGSHNSSGNSRLSDGG